MSSNKKRKTKHIKRPPLPKPIRDELRMTCALKGYSNIKCGKSKKLVDQHDELYDFFHGKMPMKPSQIGLLSSASLNYKDMFEEENVVITSKKTTTSSVVKYCLKTSLSRDQSRKYYVGEDILAPDLEKKNRSGALLVSGRNLLDMALRGIKCYKKALAFCLQKWDMEKMVCKKSGDTVEDVIDHVRLEMYKLHHKKKDNEESEPESEELIEKDNNAADKDVNNSNDAAEVAVASTIDPGTTNDGEKDGDAVTTNVAVEESAVSTTNANKEDDEASQSSTSDESINAMPASYIFPSFFVFMLWGPFVPPEKRLPLVLTCDKGKKKSGTRAEQRTKDRVNKMIDLVNDTKNVRGFSTDQRIQIENLNEQKKNRMDRKRECNLVGYCIEEAALARQIESAERRASVRCPDYDPNNIYWQKVDGLLLKQDELLKQISTFNKEEQDHAETISPFLNEPSPEKAKATTSPRSKEIPISIAHSDSITELTSLSTNSSQRKAQESGEGRVSGGGSK